MIDFDGVDRAGRRLGCRGERGKQGRGKRGKDRPAIEKPEPIEGGSPMQQMRRWWRGKREQLSEWWTEVLKQASKKER